tara:strand:+ start:7176 stop:7475 length:300 start_codon:yes stop_codon:yes gene_type:complete
MACQMASFDVSVPYRLPKSARWHCTQRVAVSLGPHWRAAARRVKLCWSEVEGLYVKAGKAENQVAAWWAGSEGLVDMADGGGMVWDGLVLGEDWGFWWG